MLRADPVFFRSLTRGKGARRTALSVENASDEPIARAILAVRSCPEWLTLERVLPGGETAPLVADARAEGIPEAERRRSPAWIVLGPRRRLQLVATVDTDHRFLPRGSSELPRDVSSIVNEGALLELDLSHGERLDVPVTIAEVVLSRDPFDGTFALDFGTTNSCWAWKRRRGGPAALERPPACSPEVPSLVFMKDLRQRERPKVLVGHKARLAVLANPSRVWAAVEGSKRLLGTNRSVTVLDPRGRSATYRPHEVAAFAVRAILDQAEAEALDGRRVQRLVVTYPTLFSPRHKRALQDAVLLALRLGDEHLVPEELLAPGPRSDEDQARCDELVALRLDEANAATFRLVTGPLLEACLRFNREQTADVLSFDMGGGTTDVSLLRLVVRRDAAQRQTRIEARILGCTGEAFFGGDDASLELVRLLRAKLAVEAARALTSQAQAQASSAKAAEGLDIFDRILQGGGLPAPAEARRASDVVEDDDDLPPPPLEKRLAAARVLAQHAEVVLRAAAEGRFEHPLVQDGHDAFVEHLRDLLRAQAAESGRPFLPSEAERIDEALERLLPTRFARHTTQDPLLERRAKVLFMDLWREANDRLKPLLVARAGGDTSSEAAAAARASVQEPLERLARWVGVDPKLWNDRVSVTLAELEHMVEARVRRVVTKARDLYLRAVEPGAADDPEATGAEAAPLVSTGAQRRPQASGASARPARPKLTVLLTGNASILPVVRRTFEDVLAGIDHDLAWDERTRKTSVVQGAVEEALLAAEFGQEGGGVHYRSIDWSDRIPFSIGLWSRFVGFRPLFARGARPGDVAIVDARQNELVKRGLEDLSVYADHHDGAPVTWLGTFDLRKGGRPAEADDLADLPPPEPDPRTGRPVYQAAFRLLDDHELELVEPDTGRVHRLELAPIQVDPREDPFSGVN